MREYWYTRTSWAPRHLIGWAQWALPAHQARLSQLHTCLIHWRHNVQITDDTMLNQWHRHNVQSLMRQCSITDVNMFNHWHHNVNHWRHNAQLLTSQCSICDAWRHNAQSLKSQCSVTEITIVNHWCQSSQCSVTDITMLSHWHHNTQTRTPQWTPQWSISDVNRHNAQSLTSQCSVADVTMLNHRRHNASVDDVIPQRVPHWALSPAPFLTAFYLYHVVLCWLVE